MTAQDGEAGGSGSPGSLRGKTVLITGVASGLGRELTLALARLGPTIVMVDRDAESAGRTRDDVAKQTANTDIELLISDLSSQASVREMVAAFRSSHDELHFLVNNAGGMRYERQLTVDGLEYNLALNYLGPFLITNLLIDVLQKSAPARVVNVVSEIRKRTTIDFDNLQGDRSFRPIDAYVRAKYSLTIATRTWADRLHGTGVAVNAVHPGFFKSAFGLDNPHEPLLFRIMRKVTHRFVRDPEDAAKGVLHVLLSPEAAGVSGEYFVKSKRQPPPALTEDPAVRDRLWATSVQLAGLPEST